mgnify:CR=1 FL=1
MPQQANQSETPATPVAEPWRRNLRGSLDGLPGAASGFAGTGDWYTGAPPERCPGRLADGTIFAPKYLENKLKFFPNIKEAVAYGDSKEFVCAILNIDPAAVANWAERNNIAYGSYQELA